MARRCTVPDQGKGCSSDSRRGERAAPLRGLPEIASPRFMPAAAESGSIAIVKCMPRGPGGGVGGGGLGSSIVSMTRPADAPKEARFHLEVVHPGAGFACGARGRGAIGRNVAPAVDRQIFGSRTLSSAPLSTRGSGKPSKRLDLGFRLCCRRGQ